MDWGPDIRRPRRKPVWVEGESLLLKAVRLGPSRRPTAPDSPPALLGCPFKRGGGRLITPRHRASGLMDPEIAMAVKTERERLEPDLERIAHATLKELGDIRIDDVLSFIDRGIENMPSYMDLYRRWESQQWAVGDLDFTLDRQDWLEATDQDRKATLWSHRLFFNGEERVTSTLAPFVWAAPTPEIEIFLSTQMVDEARR